MTGVILNFKSNRKPNVDRVCVFLFKDQNKSSIDEVLEYQVCVCVGGIYFSISSLIKSKRIF